jgi:aromatic-L-amino-acid decarboxylase
LSGAGAAYLTHTRLDDRFVLRVAIGGAATGRAHVERLWHLLRDTADAVSSESDR